MPGIIISEASEQNNPLFGQWQAPIAGYLRKRAEAFEQMSIARKIFKIRKSTHASESYGAQTGFDNFLPSVENGDYPTTDSQTAGMKTIQNITWKNEFSISWEMVQDANLIKFQDKPKAFIAAYYRTQEEFFAKLLAEAWMGSKSFKIGNVEFDLTTMDGLPAFSKNHKTVCSNEAIPNAFSDAFSAQALARAATTLQITKGDKGETLAVWPDTIIIPDDADLKEEVLAVVGSEKKPGTANNDLNPQYGNWNVLIWPYLNRFLKSGVKPWMVCDGQFCDENHSLIWQERHPLEVTSHIEGNDANTWKGKARFGGGFAESRGMLVGGISGGATL